MNLKLNSIFRNDLYYARDGIKSLALRKLRIKNIGKNVSMSQKTRALANQKHQGTGIKLEG